MTSILRHSYIHSKPQTSIQHNPNSYLRQWYLSYASLTFIKNCQTSIQKNPNSFLRKWHVSYATLAFIPNLRHLFNTIQTAIYDSDIYFTPPLHLFQTSDIYSTQSKQLFTTVTSILRHPYATLTFIQNLRHLFNTIQTAIYDSDIYLTPSINLFYSIYSSTYTPAIKLRLSQID